MPQRARYRKRSNPLLPWPRKLGPDERRARLNLCIFNTRLLCIFHASFCHTGTVPWNRTATKTRAQGLDLPRTRNTPNLYTGQPAQLNTHGRKPILQGNLSLSNSSSLGFANVEGGTFTFELCTSLARIHISYRRSIPHRDVPIGGLTGSSNTRKL